MNTWFAGVCLAAILAGTSPQAAPVQAKPLVGAVVAGAATVAAVPVATAAPGGQTVEGASTSASDMTLPGDGSDLGMLLLLMSAIFACIGLFRGSRREIPALVWTAASYLVIHRGWGLIDRILNLAWRFFNFVVLRRGVLAANPGQAWSDAASQAPLVPEAGAGLRMAQMLLFAVALVAIYAATRRQPEPIFIERLIGAVVASATGYMVGVFMLSRIMPEAKINLLAPGDAALRWIQTLGPMAGLILVAAVIVFGWRSLGPKGFAKRYG